MAEIDRTHGEAIEARESAFGRRLGISELAFPQQRARAVRHAQLARAAPPVANQPWVCFGPRNVAGRILSLVQDPTDALVLYAGSAFGGLWRTADAGDSWEHLGQAEHNFPVGALAIHPQRPNVLFVGSGSVDPNHVSGQGLFRVEVPAARGLAAFDPINAPLRVSTFVPLATAPGPEVSPANATNAAALRYTRIEVDPDEPLRFWAASQTGLWRGKVVPGAPPVANWVRDFPPATGPLAASAPLATTLPRSGSWPAYATDLRIVHDPRDTSTTPGADGRPVRRYLVLYLAVEGVGIFRGRFDRAAANPDGAAAVQWEKQLAVPNPALGNPFGRVIIAICRNRPEVLYAVMENQTGFNAVSNLPNPEHNHATFVYRSADHGETWQQRGRIPRAYLLGEDPTAASPAGQASYDLVLEVNPDDPDILVCGEVDLCRSEDSGSTWLPILNWQNYDDGDYAQHGDQHVAVFDIADRKRLWVGNDGGLVVARDLHGEPAARAFWRRRSAGIIAGQFQDVTVHPNPLFSFLSGGGLQDNGSWVGYGGPTWYRIGGGDGGMVAVHATDPRRCLAGAQFSNSMTAVVSNAAQASLVNPVAADIPTPANSMFVGGFGRAVPIPGGGPFVSVQEQDPLVPGQALVGWTMAAGSAVAFWTAPPGAFIAGAATAVPLPAPPVDLGEEGSAVTFGPALPASPTVFGWIGTTDGRVFSTPTAPAAGWVESVTFPRLVGTLRSITRIASHPGAPTMVAVASIPERRPVQITITTGSAPGPAQFTAQHFNFSGQAFGVASAPVTVPAAGASVAIPGTSMLAQFPGAAYAVGNAWVVQLNGAVAPAAPVLRVTLTEDRTLTMRIAAPGAVGVATFTCGVGAFAPSGPHLSAAAIEVPGTDTVFEFSGGPFVAGHSWTVAADDTVTPVGAVAGALRVAARLHGRVHLTYDAGATWADISCPTAPPAAPADARTASLPPCTITSLCFDVDPTPPGRLSLYCGTLVGAYVMHNLPAPVAAPPIPAVNAAWRPYNGTLGQPLPLTLVTDIEMMTVPAAAAPRRILRAATFGRGIWDCELNGGPRFQPYIRQTLIEDGRRYPRTIPPVAAPGFAGADADYRMPRAAAFGYDFTHAFDIRVDSAPLKFFEDEVDGVEFDEELGADTLMPLAPNAVYVQVHNSGFDVLGNVTVHLYFAACAAAPLALPPGSPVPAGLPPAADFWDQPGFNPLPASALQRVSPAQTIARLAPEQPMVLRFDWSPPAVLAGGNVALLAMCSALQSPLPTPRPPAIVSFNDLITNEPRAALRIVPVGALPVPTIFVRDGIDDDGRFGAVAFAGRSPDIIVVANVPAEPPATAFKDLLDSRPQDSLRSGVTNQIYVRVHNRGAIVVNAEVHLFAAAIDAAGSARNAPPFAPGSWTRLTPDPANPAPPQLQVPVAAGGVAYALQSWVNPPDPNGADAVKAYALIALIRNANVAGSAVPDATRVTSLATFWQFFGSFFDAGHAALRVLRYR